MRARTKARQLSSAFSCNCRDGGVWPASAFAGPLQALDFRESGSRQSVGKLIDVRSMSISNSLSAVSASMRWPRPPTQSPFFRHDGTV